MSGQTTTKPPSTILAVDRSVPVNFVELLGDEGWSIWKGPVDGDGLAGEEQQDPCALSLTEIDLSNINFFPTLRHGEGILSGKENLRRLKAAGCILPDAKVCETLLKNEHLIPTSWNEKEIYFFGTILRSPGGDRCVLCIRRDGEKWECSFYWFGGSIWYAALSNAVLVE